jgi:hypothetical protein
MRERTGGMETGRKEKGEKMVGERRKNGGRKERREIKGENEETKKN